MSQFLLLSGSLLSSQHRPRFSQASAKPLHTRKSPVLLLHVQRRTRHQAPGRDFLPRDPPRCVGRGRQASSSRKAERAILPRVPSTGLRQVILGGSFDPSGSPGGVSLTSDDLPAPQLGETQEAANKRPTQEKRHHNIPMPAPGTELGDWLDKKIDEIPG
jgi:hypothetical protein